MATWLIQCNPRRYDLPLLLKGWKRFLFGTPQYFKQIRSGDTVYFWYAGKDGGVAAKGRIVEDPKQSQLVGDQESFWLGPPPAAGLHWLTLMETDRVLARVLPVHEAKADPDLSSANIFRIKAGTVFRLKDGQAAAIESLIEGIPSATPDESKENRTWLLALARLRSHRVARRERDPAYRESLEARDGVLAKYGPLFSPEGLPALTADQFQDFLRYSENHHWTNIQRWAGRLSVEMPLLRETLGRTLDESIPLARRYDAAVEALKGMKKATLTPILLVAQPGKYGVWNAQVDESLEMLGLKPDFPAKATEGEQYEIINGLLHRLKDALDVDFWELDILLWGKALSENPWGGGVTMVDPIEAAEDLGPLNRIYYGPPGTGKTFAAMREALRICGFPGLSGTEAAAKRRELMDAGRLQFVTFHQSFSYEEFVEGIRPEVDDDSGELLYEPRDGIFKRVCLKARESRGTAGAGEGEPPLEDVRIWKVSLGRANRPEERDIYEDCIENGRIRIGYGWNLDFSDCEDRDSVLARIQEKEPSYRRGTFDVRVMHDFRNEMATGDIVLVSEGLSGIRAIGRVAGEYALLGREFKGRHIQSRPVRWLRVFEEAIPPKSLLQKGLSMATLYELGRGKVDLGALADLLAEGAAPGEAPREGGADPCVLVIDEINRANISKVLGELITLIEPDKRLGAENEITLTLPYSGLPFGVPSNLYILGTMNTADRSLAFLDLALRRRFEFVPVRPDLAVLREEVGEVEGVDVARLLEVLNERIEFLLDGDHALGHAYFLGVETLDDLAAVFRAKVLPLLEEYFHGDGNRMALVLGCPFTDGESKSNSHPLLAARVRRAADLFGAAELDREDGLKVVPHPEFLKARGADLRPYFEALIAGTKA